MWHPDTSTTGELPLTEKEAGEEVSYPFRVHKISTSQNIELAYVDEGDPEADVILFVHGMGAGTPVWEKNIRFLKNRYRCVALDLPGHGHSAKAEFPFTMAFYSEVLLSFIQALNLPPLTLAGHSMGSLISFITALARPDAVEKVVLVSPAGLEPYLPLEKQMLIGMTAGVVATGQAFTNHKLNYMLGFCNDRKEAGELARKMPFHKDDAVVFGKMMLRSVESMLLESVDQIVDQLTLPCLMLVGKQDIVSPYNFLRGENFYEIIERQARKLPNGKAVVFSPCGHYLQYQRPDFFNEEVLEFMKEKAENR